jgi:hypothetical protein
MVIDHYCEGDCVIICELHSGVYELTKLYYCVYFDLTLNNINVDLEPIYVKFYLYSQKYACAHVD